MTLVIVLDFLLITGVITSISATTLDKSWFGSAEFSVLQKVYNDCQDSNDFAECLKDKATVAITKAIDQDNVEIVDGLYFQRQNAIEKESIVDLSEARTMTTLSAKDRDLFEKLDKFLRTHVVKVDINQARFGDDDDGKGGGGKGGYGGKGGGGGKKKGKESGEMIKYVLAALLTAFGIAGPMALKVLGAIAGKALIISKVALTIAGIIALKKLFSHDHHEESSFQVHTGEHNRRNTYVLHPIKVNPTSADPYKYYYEYGH